MALVLEDILKGEILNDPRYVKWYAVFINSVAGKTTSKPIPMHTCTEKDFEKFYEPSEIYAKRFQHFRTSGAMQCIDWETSGVEIYGSTSSDNFGSLDIIAAPCAIGM